MNKLFALILGIIFLALGLVMFTNPPRHFNDDATYQRTKTFKGHTVSKEVVSGTQLNLEEPSNNQGIRIGGAIFILVGGVCVWSFYSSRNHS